MQGFLADIQYFTIEEAAALIANKYGWHEDAQKIFVKQLLGAAKNRTLIVRRPHRDFPHRPKDYHQFFDRVRVFDLNRYLEVAGAPWRLDNSDETTDSETEWWNLHQALQVAQVFPHQRAIAEVATHQIEWLSGCHVSFLVAQQALSEALQTRKLTAYGLKNGEGVLTEIPPLQWADRTFLWHPDYAGLASRWIALRFRRKDILALWPVSPDQPDDKAPAEEEPAAPATSCDTAAHAATSKHTANVGKEPGVPSVHIGDNAFTSMDGLTWAEITITFIETESVRIRARGRNETFTFDAMGFRHRTSHMAKPNECWKTFLQLAIVSTSNKTWNDFPRTPDLKKRISRLRDQLQQFFAIADDPIAFRKSVGYQPAFNLTAEEHVIQETRERYIDRADEDEGDVIQQVMSEVPGSRSR